MTRNELEKIIEIIKEQRNYENKCSEAMGVMCPECHQPFLSNPIWVAVEMALNTALGLEDFFAWWIWETDCGENDKARIWLEDGTEVPVRTAEEIIEYSKM